MTKLNKHHLIFKSIIFVAIFSLLINTIPLPVKNENIVANVNVEYIKPKQYSDTYITREAILANQNLSHLEQYKEIKPNHTNDIASAFASIKSIINRNKPIREGEKEHGTWIWTPIPDMTNDYIDSIVKKAVDEDVNVIYMSIDSYLDILSLSTNEETKQNYIENKKIFDSTVSYFLKKAKESNIQVDAVGGWRNWAEDGHRYKPFAILDYVKEFNSLNEIKFRGIQYDIEPYLLERYEQEKEDVLLKFISLVEQLVNVDGLENLRFSVAIPEFYDSKSTFSPKLSYKNQTKSLVEHLLEIFSAKEDTSIIIMAYRNKAEGEDGSIEISQDEIRIANKFKYKTEIIVAQETGDVLPPYITYHNTSKEYLEQEISKISKRFNKERSFGGIAIHYVNAFVSLP